MKLGFTYKEAVGQIIGDLEIIGYDDERNELELQRFNNGETKKLKKHLLFKCLKCNNIFSRSFSNLYTNNKCPNCVSIENKNKNFDIIGNIYGNIKIIKLDYINKKSVYFYKCECLKCGDIFTRSKSSILKNGINYKCLKCDIIKYNINKLNINYIFTKNQKTYINYTCEKNHTSNLLVSDFKRGSGCCYCQNKKVLKGFNDIATTNPELVKYFVNLNESFLYTNGSEHKIKVKCPDCGFQKNMRIANLNIYKKISCPYCSDGISYPEKILITFLNKLNIDFKTQKTFKWSQRKRYDFYIPLLNCIIETHGGQHYNNGFESLSNKTLEEEQSNDQLKECLAKENGIEHYIVLDCRKSELEWIKNSILNSELNELFDLSNVDWNECEKSSFNSYKKDILKKFENGETAVQILKKSNLGSTTVYRYLRSHNNYKKKTYKISKIYCKELDIIFDNMEKVKSYFKKILNINFCKMTLKKSLENKKSIKTYDILFIEENITFKSIKEVKNYIDNKYNININGSKISSVCLNNRKTTFNFHFKYINYKEYHFEYYIESEENE